MMISKLIYKLSWVFLLYILLFSQYKLWFSDEGIITYWSLERNVAAQRNANANNMEINSSLYAEVSNLKQGSSAIEERARNDLGLIKNNERYYQIVE